MGSCLSVKIKAETPGATSKFVLVPPTARSQEEILESPNLKSFSFNDIKLATRNFRPDSVLGEGGFGCVFKGWINEDTFAAAKAGTGLVIAVKRLGQESFQGHKEWLAEINYLGQLCHPNLVKLIGYCLEDEHRLLIYEFMPRGSLDNHLFRRSTYFQPLSWNLRMRVALGAAKGLAYLHSPEAKVIYRDFKCSNILIDSKYNAKLSDFGLAKDGPMDGKSHVSTRIMGTYGYAAPEYMVTVAEKIEEATKPKDLETTRMKRAGKVFKDPRLGDHFPEFLLQAMEPSEEGPSQVLRTKQRSGAYFQPAWGIRGKDSIVGSTALSKEWSKHSISPVDYQDFVLQQDLEGNELFGAQALATANAHFQGAIHQAKAWKVGLEDANKKLEEANQRIEALEAQLASSTSDLETARAENVILKAQKDKAFDGWMDTQEFKDLMVEHDALLHPVSYKEGWNAAVEAIQDEFPEVLEQSSFPCPVRVPELGGVTEKLADMIKDGPSGSQGHKRKELGSSSGEEEDSSEEEFEPATKKVRVEELPRAAPQQPTSPAEGTSTGTAEGTTETSEGTTETSEETSDSGSEESQPSKA